jgi:hypothetical protein
MAGSKKLLCGALLLIPLAGAACTGIRPPVTRSAKSQPPSEAETAAKKPPDPDALPPSHTPEPVPEPTTTSNPAPAPKPPSGRAVDVVDPGGDSGPVSLVQAAKTEKERRSHSGEPVAIITDKTLPHLPKGQLTYASPGKKTAAAKGGADAARDQKYWSDRALDIRSRWRKAADEVKELQAASAGWRRRFYAENDPYVRDSQVKPEWDRVLDRLGKARTEVEDTKKELEDFLEEGRQAGALPGWLREGAEVEPVEEKKIKGPGTLDSKEPSIYKQPPQQQPEDHHQ